ncbi:MAG: hypothetical protein MJZ69_08070 [Bacteroidaceae bacterium]|nr:hypothetical protein [Candidatus Minthousia equi]MCQ2246725.1 hypothetical protein [Bacteroidaceae bacterium]MDO4956741.1 hypothetical protein [Bacteroidales bacterium]
MNTPKVRTYLNALFILGAIASVIIYFTCGYTPLFMWVILTSFALKLAEFFIRFMF